jgi:hypothetical protein
LPPSGFRLHGCCLIFRCWLGSLCFIWFSGNIVVVAIPLLLLGTTPLWSPLRNPGRIGALGLAGLGFGPPVRIGTQLEGSALAPVLVLDVMFLV